MEEGVVSSKQSHFGGSPCPMGDGEEPAPSPPFVVIWMGSER